MDDKKQEIMLKLSMFEQQMNNINRQLQAVEEGIFEMSSLSLGLDELKGSEGKEVLSPLGRGVFAKTKLSSEDLMVDIGEKNFVKKSIPETKEIISDQIGKLNEIKDELTTQMNSLEQELTKAIDAAEKLE